MKTSFNFSITRKEGINFSKLSGDTNKIHINERTGYNSYFGFNICHGVLVLFKFFKIINIKNKIENKKQFNVNIDFNNPAFYNTTISVKQISQNAKKFSYKLVQKKNIIAIINIHYNYHNNFQIKKITGSKRLKLNKKLFNYYLKSSTDPILGAILCSLTKYVGTIYPGKNSIITKININFNLLRENKKKFISIISNLVDKRLPLIENKLKYKNYVINFETLLAPKLKINFNKPNTNFLQLINSIKENVLIIGASSGIGYDLLNLFKFNKKIKIIATYYKNPINIKGGNIIKKKLDVKQNLNLVNSIITKFNPLIIYYFPTPKIYSVSTGKKIINDYKNFYIDYPLRILKFSKNYPVKFFYPSTTYTTDKKFLAYSKIKLKAENKILKIKGNKLKINILKIGEINTKQNLSLIPRNLPNFRDFLFEDEDIQKKVFFK